MSSLGTIRQIDYTVIFARDLPRMRNFYERVLGLAVERALGASWVEYKLGDTTLALTERGLLFDDPPPPAGALSLQLAFRVSREDVDRCANELAAAGVAIERPP